MPKRSDAYTEPQPGGHYEEAIGFDGRTFRYIVKDGPRYPRLVDAECVVRIVERHKPNPGDCPGCVDGNVSETSVLVEHTTWGDAWITDVCFTCGQKATKWLAKQEAAS